ncbi:glycosyltransferase [Mucilaginibacter auburnensis]|uniref:Cellulose synthase/poly-beta-1,6-N-acetylglucosamine synthase-like glycosyltransferase n=1 Tax=Mucilaginibacter auburnensis TaxID=1457233 RepID=A0A2H9VSD8_9SPHI|nr:glycosyltransferase family 2 protein [Mucilaginibacter auburnensis]PJJ83709.1 cellulose synthase/poly-beta-1,6-N-acetylglucosamine synthase-like glycosyltransferase [Mucilaginibacter auburnensis]
MTINTLLEIYGIVAGATWIGVVVYLIIGFKKIKMLKDQPLSNAFPPLAIIIPVRNEEENLENALQSVCNINYPNYRIIAVNDRSTDSTGEILSKLNAKYPQLTVTTIADLPHGWLGKNNALYQGYLSSTEEWMLFTDADVEYQPDAISKAVGYAINNNLDNLAVLPNIISRSGLLNSVLSSFTIMLMIYLRPWDAIKPGTKAHIGVGAFCLVKRSAYEKAGTHANIKLRPDDDVMLGKNIKMAGLRQGVLGGREAIGLEWYTSLKQFVDGLMKNTFATAGYNPVMAIGFIMACIVCFTLPIPVMLIFGGVNIKLLAGAVLFAQIIYMLTIKPNKWWYAFVIPFAGGLMGYIFLKSMLITLKQGGIYWRDSFYSLKMLKEGSNY